ncbi:MAG: hypothetical protein V1851_03090 [Patescibacteria group bacterium]
MLNLKTPQKIIIKTFLFLLIYSLLGNFALAEINNYEQDIKINLNPEFPNANSNINAKAEFYLTDLDRATIRWYINGVLKKEGRGEKEFSFQTSDFGKSTQLSVTVSSENIGTAKKEIIIIPADVDVLWEAETFVPYFYKGKALNTHESIIKLVAFPNFIDLNGNKISDQNLIYTWEEDGKNLTDKSGYGKNILSITGPQLFRKSIITLEVSNLDKNIKSKKIISLKSFNPEIIFYEKNPLLGVLNNKALEKNSEISNEEINIIAYPFFFSTQNNQISYNWTVDENKIDTQKNEIIIRNTNGETGFSTVSLEIKNLNRIMQFAKNSFNLIFK